MGQLALYKPVVKWWLSLSSSSQENPAKYSAVAPQETPPGHPPETHPRSRGGFSPRWGFTWGETKT